MIDEEDEYEEDIPYFDPYDYYDENPLVDDTTWQRALDSYEKSFDTYDL